MAKRSTLLIRIVEGKNLPAKDITGSSDPYCIVKIDDEATIRTATMWKTLSPFWGEEYNVHLPSTFHSVSFYVMDEDALSRDDVIGKVCLSKEVLAGHPQGFDGWLNLTEIDPDDEVQGEIHLQIETYTKDASQKLCCSVFEARDLARKDRNGASDPFVRVQYNGRTQESSVIKKSCYPRWNETFEFELNDSGSENRLNVEVWDWDLVGKNDFLGKVVFNINNLQAVRKEEGWFRLGPDKGKPSEDEGTLGSVRLHLRLRDETILPSSYYQPLVQMLCQAIRSNRKNEKCNLLTLIDETTTAECRQEVATNLVKLFLGQGLAKELLDVLFKLELEKTSEPNTLFRSNSLASKSMESFLKLVGMQYLHNVLGPIVNRVFEERKYVELDPSKVESKEVGCAGLHRIQTEAEVIQQSTHHLQSYLTQLLNLIVKSVKQCPAVIRATFKKLYRRVEERFPENEYRNVKFIAVTSFLCLRFFSPAIMSPKLFHLREKYADAWTSRTLLLLAKAVQSVGNLDVLAGRVKEKWMMPLQPTIHQGASQMKEFITRLIDIEEKEELEFQKRLNLQTPTVKEGFLCMYSNKTKEKGLLMSSPFKKLYFTIRGDALCYAKMPNSKKSAFIPLSRIQAVEKVEEKSFGNSHVMQIISTDETGHIETLYVQCKCVNELNQWLSALRKSCINNPEMLCSYHPGMFKGDKWSCCHQKDKTASGCDKTRHGVRLQEWNDPLDPDLESQLIFRHLLGVRDSMRQKYLELVKTEENKRSTDGPDQDSENTDTVTRLFQVLQDLEKVHRDIESTEGPKDRHFLLELQT
ncbi:ras GTPase-activating protein 4 [Latimeria chalumnae]|uniref:RAS p21 protein activator 4 n=1 Tax=Latimeria chalumnae TaxID=7897 RepID=H3BGR4_LATCH|nr:PREDICTED: ras GTPase-activating protein 4B [Latimeria chalumnae]|eukprot:XP_005986917.1 PREDICTED: ras GTPase-activating protein 4B [Latimeria chalumnae]